MGVLGAVSSAAVAWMAIRQYEVLVRSYSVASSELATIDAKIGGSVWADEMEWARFVDDAENAISREHTSWRAYRGT